VKQVALLSVGDRTRACPLCDGVITGARCHLCRNTFPRPGTSSHRRWTRGITAVVRRRLENAGLSALAPDACRALILGDIPIPSAAAGLIGDIAAMPISVEAYQREIDRCVDMSLGEIAARDEGLAGEVATTYAAAFAAGRKERRERRRMPRLRVEVPTLLRVAAVTSEDSAGDAEAAAREEEATDEAAAAHGPQRIARTR